MGRIRLEGEEVDSGVATLDKPNLRVRVRVSVRFGVRVRAGFRAGVRTIF